MRKVVVFWQFTYITFIHYLYFPSLPFHFPFFHFPFLQRNRLKLRYFLRHTGVGTLNHIFKHILSFHLLPSSNVDSQAIHILLYYSQTPIRHQKQGRLSLVEGFVKTVSRCSRTKRRFYVNNQEVGNAPYVGKKEHYVARFSCKFSNEKSRLADHVFLKLKLCERQPI